MRPLPILAAILPWLGMALPGAMAQGSGALQAERVAYGRVVAENWCANCHLVGPRQTAAPGDAAPPFATVARMASTTEMALRAFLRTPHSRMPDFRLSNAELDGVVA
jgi:mono/diheme cytochrome c family protein